MRSWAETDAIGQDALMTVREARTERDTTTLNFDWQSQRLDGTSTAIVTVRDGLVSSVRIPPHSE